MIRAEREGMTKIGVAFGGGGARGLAHVGVLRALDKRPEYLPRMVAGTSVGSIVAALYAAGLSQDEIEETAKGFDWFHDVINITDTVKHALESKGGGLVSNEKLGRMVNTLLEGKGFQDLPFDLAVTATDIENRRRVIFTSPKVAKKMKSRILSRFLPGETEWKPGCSTLIVSDFEDVGTAVRASCAIPGVFLPVEIKEMRLLDGGAVDQVPVDVVKAMGADFTIGVSLSLTHLADGISNVTSVLSGLISVLGIHQLRASLDLADIGFQITGIEKRSIIDPRQLDLIDIGERDMQHWFGEMDKRLDLRVGLLPRIRKKLSRIRKK
jgi:NTE family protein